MAVKQILSGFLVLAIVFPGLAWGADQPNEDALKEDLRKLQGKWEHTFKDKEGNTVLKKVKEVKGNTETVTWFLPDDKVHMVNTVEFKLEIKGKDRVFRWFNGKVVEGPSKGKSFQSGAFIYMLDGDTWTEMPESGGKVTWQRVKEKKEQ